jgi:hypothetical protein
MSHSDGSFDLPTFEGKGWLLWTEVHVINFANTILLNVTEPEGK